MMPRFVENRGMSFFSNIIYYYYLQANSTLGFIRRNINISNPLVKERADVPQDPLPLRRRQCASVSKATFIIYKI